MATASEHLKKVRVGLMHSVNIKSSLKLFKNVPKCSDDSRKYISTTECPFMLNKMVSH